MKNAPLTRLWTALRWALALLILVAIVRLVQPADLADAMSKAPIRPLLFLIVIYLALAFIFDTAYWQYFLRLFQIRRPFSELLVVRGHTYLLMIIHYGLSVGGIGVYLTRNAGVTARRSAGLMFLFMVVEALTLAVMAFFTLTLSNTYKYWPYQIFAGAFIAGLLGIYFLLRWQPINAALSHIGFPAELLSRTPLKHWVLIVLLRIPHQMLMVVFHFLALPLFEVQAPAEEIAAIVPLLLFVNGLPVTPAGLGTTQAATVLLFEGYGSVESIIAFSIACLVLMTLGRLLIGLWSVWRNPRLLSPASSSGSQ